jgi:hypothetical protein
MDLRLPQQPIRAAARAAAEPVAALGEVVVELAVVVAVVVAAGSWRVRRGFPEADPAGELALAEADSSGAESSRYSVTFTAQITNILNQ